jgi:hypothetical protein
MCIVSHGQQADKTHHDVLRQMLKNAAETEQS